MIVGIGDAVVDLIPGLPAFVRLHLQDPVGLDDDIDHLRDAYAHFCGSGLHQACRASTVIGLHLVATLAAQSGAFALLALQQCYANSLSDEITFPCGVAIGHLRTPHRAPILRNGQISGHVPWMSGASIFPAFLLGFVTDETDEGIVLIRHGLRDVATRVEPIRLACANSSDTVEFELEGLSVSESDILLRRAIVSPTDDPATLRWTMGLLLGNLLASTRMIMTSDLVPSREKNLAIRRFTGLNLKVYEAVEQGHGVGELIRLRAALGDWSVRFVRLAALAAGSSASKASHPSHRIAAEGKLFSNMALSPTILAASYSQALE